MKITPSSNPMSFDIWLTKLGDSLCPQRPGPAKEFHVSRASRRRFQFNQALFSLSSNVILADYQAVRVVAQKMNEKRDLERFPEKAVRAGSMNAMGLIDEILHYVVSLYEAQARPQLFKLLMADL